MTCTGTTTLTARAHSYDIIILLRTNQRTILLVHGATLQHLPFAWTAQKLVKKCSISHTPANTALIILYDPRPQI